MEYTERDYSINMVKANFIITPLMFVLLGILLGIAYLAIGLDERGSFFEWQTVLPAIAIGVIIHEAIHALTWMKLANLSKEDVTFGFNWKAVMPYAHIKVPIRKDHYMIGAALPGIILGLIPFFLGLFVGSDHITWFGILMILGAGGDMWIMWTIRNVPNDALVQDHATRAGCVVFEKA